MRRQFVAIFSLVALLLLGIASWVYAQQTTDTSTITFDFYHSSSKKSADDGSRVTQYEQAVITQGQAQFSAEVIVDNSKGTVHNFTCTGNPKFHDPENDITATTVIGHSTPRSADFLGNVVADSTPKVDPNSKSLRGNPTHITSDKLTYEYARKWGEFSGGVTMLITPRASAKVGDSSSVSNQFSSAPSTITCDALSYDANVHRALAKSNVVVKQKERTLWAENGTYDETAGLVVLTGNVRIKNEGEGEVKSFENADKVTISVAGTDEWIDAIAKDPSQRIKMVIMVPKDEGTTKPK